MARWWRRIPLPCAVCLAFALVLLRPLAAAAQDACFKEIQDKLAGSYALLEVELDASKKPVYTFLAQKGCDSGACAQVVLSRDKAALPSEEIAGVKPSDRASYDSGSCKAKPAYSVTYSA